jgi:urea transport system substrate-binding protein
MNLHSVGLIGVVTAVIMSHGASAEEAIKIGVPVGLSGANSVIAPSVVQSSELAVEEINAKGGVLGRKLELKIVDDRSNAAGAQQAFDLLVFRDKVDVIISMETSSARNAGLPIAARGKVPYIYTSPYEGGACSRYLFADDWVPDQQLSPLVDYFMDVKSAKTFFLVGTDYAFGRGELDITRKAVERKGGKIVGEEYAPMDATDWTAIIGKIRAAHPDALITATAGGAPIVTFTKQLRASGISALYGNTSIDEATAKQLGADAEGIYLSASYISSIDSPANKSFLAAMKKKFGAKLETPNSLSIPQYEAIYLYEAAVEKAGSIESEAVVKAIPEVSIDGPRGRLQISKEHHPTLTMYLGQFQADGAPKLIKVFKNVNPGDQCPNLK